MGRGEYPEYDCNEDVKAEIRKRERVEPRPWDITGTLAHLILGTRDPCFDRIYPHRGYVFETKLLSHSMYIADSLKFYLYLHSVLHQSGPCLFSYRR